MANIVQSGLVVAMSAAAARLSSTMVPFNGDTPSTVWALGLGAVAACGAGLAFVHAREAFRASVALLSRIKDSAARDPTALGLAVTHVGATLAPIAVLGATVDASPAIAAVALLSCAVTAAALRATRDAASSALRTQLDAEQTRGAETAAA
jgi:hypothetical protein